jgi:peptide/nickel transport system permease protein
MIPTIIAISMISFMIIELPPGDFVDSYVAELERFGDVVDQSEIEALKIHYGVDEPVHVHYIKWVWGIIRGDLGRSLQWNKPVLTLILERLPWSFIVSFTGLIFVYAIGIPIGTTAATHQYSIRDYFFTFIGFIGLAIPNFLFALIMMWLYFVHTGNAMVGLFSPDYIMAPWSISKFLDLLKHLWMPGLIVGTAGTCGLIRVMRASILDELQKPYVMVARAKGLSERKLLYKYPFRIAINPVISTIGWILPGLISGELLTSIVLGLPTLAPVFLDSLLNKDMFLAGSVVFIFSILTVIGTLVSDILLAWVDPRIREAV